jgi:hypothetical protein
VVVFPQDPSPLKMDTVSVLLLLFLMFSLLPTVSLGFISFHVLVGNEFVLFDEVSVQIFWLFLIGLILLIIQIFNFFVIMFIVDILS